MGRNHFADWDLKLQQTMVEMFPLRSEDAAYNKVKGMLASLGDPFTRIISPKVQILKVPTLLIVIFLIPSSKC